MNDAARNSNYKKRGSYPRKSDRELESFLPESMRNPVNHTGMLRNSQYQRKNQYNNQFVGAGGHNHYNIYSDEASQVYGNKRAKERRYDSQAWADKYYDDEDNASPYAQSKVSSSSRRGIITAVGNNMAQSKKMVRRPVNTFSSETFQAPTSAGRHIQTPSKIVMARYSGSAGKKKEPELRMTILKPVGQLPSNTPVILSRTKVDSNSTKGVPASSSMAVLSNSNNKAPTSNAVYKIAIKPPVMSGPDLKIVPEKIMRRPFRLIDDDFHLCEGSTALNAYLLEQTNFLVVGVVGRQGVGKSSVAAMLAGQSPHQGSVEDSSSFRLAGASQATRCSHATKGLDVWVTNQRMLVLDFPAMLGTGVMDATTGRGADHAALCQAVPLELQVYAKALQFLSLALKVCHAVVLVQDALPHATEMLRCLQLASVMTKSLAPEKPCVGSTRGAPQTGPSMRGLSQGDDEKRSPSLLVVHNKTGPRDDRTPQWLHTIQAHLSRQLTGCDVDYRTGLANAGGDRVNLFFMPRYTNYNADAEANRCASDLLRAVAGVRKKAFPGYAACTERQWFEYTVREWEKIRKSSLYLDFSRLFP